MALIVQKYGGTSVGSPERIRLVAQRVAEVRRAGHAVAVVVSAMGDTTDELVQLAVEVTGRDAPGGAHPRELDMLLTAGERISMALLAMAIREHDVEAISLTGSQAAIITDDTHTAARITEIRADRVREHLDRGCIVIVAGFQGVSRGREITTLGRGGSDTSAVALAAAIGADQCQIFTDVDGVYTADPRKVPSARLVPEVAYGEMIELAAAGAQVMHPRAVEIAARFGMDVRVLSSFVDDAADVAARRGTLITRTPRRMEDLALTGITATGGQAKLTFRHLPRGLKTSTGLLMDLAEAGVSVDTIAEAQQPDGQMQLQMTISEAQLEQAMAICEPRSGARGQGTIDVVRGLSRVVLVGSGMHNRPGVYASAFRALLDADIELFAVSTSSVSITLLVPAEREDDAVRALHDAFALGGVAAAGAEG
jgi:aspartate kinase